MCICTCVWRERGTERHVLPLTHPSVGPGKSEIRGACWKTRNSQAGTNAIVLR